MLRLLSLQLQKGSTAMSCFALAKGPQSRSTQPGPAEPRPAPQPWSPQSRQGPPTQQVGDTQHCGNAKSEIHLKCFFRFRLLAWKTRSRWSCWTRFVILCIKIVHKLFLFLLIICFWPEINGLRILCSKGHVLDAAEAAAPYRPGIQSWWYGGLFCGLLVCWEEDRLLVGQQMHFAKRALRKL